MSLETLIVLKIHKAKCYFSVLQTEMASVKQVSVFFWRLHLSCNKQGKHQKEHVFSETKGNEGIKDEGRTTKLEIIKGGVGRKKWDVDERRLAY